MSIYYLKMEKLLRTKPLEVLQLLNSLHDLSVLLSVSLYSSLTSVLFLRSDMQVSYHLRFTFSPRNAPISEKSELNPNNDLDWHTHSLFPLFQLPGPREKHYKEGGTPGENSYCFKMQCYF